MKIDSLQTILDEMQSRLRYPDQAAEAVASLARALRNMKWQGSADTWESIIGKNQIIVRVAGQLVSGESGSRSKKSAQHVMGLPKGAFQPEFNSRITAGDDANPKRAALFGMLIENYREIVCGSDIQQGCNGPHVGLPLAIEIAEKNARC